MIIILSITLLAVCLYLVFLSLMIEHNRKRSDNALARIHRLEQVEDRRHAFDAAMAEKASDVIKLRCKPDENCKHCGGRGHIGKNVETGLFIPCVCCA